jgi:hypothetical protein
MRKKTSNNYLFIFIIIFSFSFRVRSQRNFLQKTSMNHYVNNGDGRDFYISYNSGGNTVNYNKL